MIAHDAPRLEDRRLELGHTSIAAVGQDAAVRSAQSLDG
jgi:hypothetical protein